MKKLTAFIALLLSLNAYAIEDSGVDNLDPLALRSATMLNTLAGDLLIARLRHQGLSNAMTSPVSLFYALSMLYEGADGATKALLERLLLTNSVVPIEALAPKLADALSTPFVEGDERGAFNLNHSLWSNINAANGRPFYFQPIFLDRVANLYDASHGALDFQSSDSAGVINAWAKESTRGMIDDIVDGKLLMPLDWAIASAAVFEGGWAIDLSRIAAGNGFLFENIDGVLDPVETVRTHSYESTAVDFADGSVAFQLPFLGGKYAFVVHSPAKDKTDIGSWLINEFIARTDEVISKVLNASAATNRLFIQMPVFSLRDAFEMRADSPITRDLGFAALFARDADYSRLSVVPTVLSLITQNTFLELDENGVRAAAVTLAAGVQITTVRMPLPKREIKVDRPFTFAVVDRETQAVLFNGVITSCRGSD